MAERQDEPHPKAWRIAFKAAANEKVSSMGDIWLGINAHVNRDLAFVYYQLGLNSYADHLHVNTVLARARLVVFPEMIATLDPTVASQTPSDPTLRLDVGAWRERAWDNAQRVAAAPNATARRVIAAKIERNAVAMANRIRRPSPPRPKRIRHATRTAPSIAPAKRTSLLLDRPTERWNWLVENLGLRRAFRDGADSREEID